MSSQTTSSTTSSSQSTPLAELNPNTTSPTKPKSQTSTNSDKIPEEKMPTHVSEAQSNTYISPSDAMLSPTTKKISEIKGRRFATAKTASLNTKALFARNMEKENGMRGGA